jgi:hypothetical protein
MFVFSSESRIFTCFSKLLKCYEIEDNIQVFAPRTRSICHEEYVLTECDHR